MTGRRGDGGTIIVRVPASQVEAIKIGPADMLRHRLADCPADFPNPVVLCAAAWVPDTAARFTFRRETGIPPQAAAFMKDHGARQAR